MKLYLIKCQSYTGKDINLCITNNKQHVISVCKLYSEKKAHYKTITDVEALKIMQNDMACQIAII